MFTIKNLLKLIIRNTLISLIFVAISVAAIYFIKSKIEIITNTIELNHKLEAELKKRTELYSTIENDAQIIGRNDILISDAFVNSNNISKFTNVLDDLAARNLVTQIYNFGTPVLSESADLFSTSTIPYTNTLTSDVLTFTNYLKNFEKLPYFTKIDSISISAQSAVGWMGLSSISTKATLLTQTIQ